MTEYVAVMWGTDNGAPTRKVHIRNPSGGLHCMWGRVEVYPAPTLEGAPHISWNLNLDIVIAPAEWVTFPC